MNESPGAQMDRQIEELGAHLVERMDRLDSDVAHSNNEIEELRCKMRALSVGAHIGIGALIILLTLVVVRMFS